MAQKQQKQQFGLNDPTQLQSQAGVPQMQQPDFMGMMQLLQGGNMNMLKQAQMPVSRISKDLGMQRGTPGLDQWHRNNPGAPAAGTYQPDGNYGQIGQDMYVRPAPQQSAQPQQSQGPGLMQDFGNMLSRLLQGLGQGSMSPQQGQQQMQPQGSPRPQAQTLAPSPSPQPRQGGIMGPSPQQQQMMRPPQMMGPPKELMTAEGFNTPPPLQLPQQPQAPAPLNYGYGAPTNPGPYGADMGGSGFMSLTSPFSAFGNTYAQEQKKDPKVPLLNAGKAAYAGLRNFAGGVYNSYK